METEKLQKGCRKEMFRKALVIKDFKGKEDSRFKCGDEFPKGYTDYRHDLKKYPKFLCSRCKSKIHSGWKKPIIGLCERYPLVEVEWFDAQSGFGQPDFIDEMIHNLKPLHTFSAGYLLNENEEGVLLGFMLFGEDMVKHNQLIPRGMIKNIKYWTQSKPKTK